MNCAIPIPRRPTIPPTGYSSAADRQCGALDGSAVQRPRPEAWQQQLTVHRGHIAVTRWGAGPTPIVLLHGAMDCGESFQLLVDAMPAEWSFAAIDWRGYGDSERRPDGYLFTHNLGDLDDVLAQLAPEQPVALIGHSLGGTVAATYAGVRPERVAWLANLEGFGLTPAPADEAPARHAAWLMALRQQSSGHEPRRYATLDELAGRIEQRNPRLGRSRALFLAAVWSRPSAAGGFELRADPLHRLRSPIRPTPEEFAACWTRVRCPALLLYGAESEVLRRLGPALTVERWCRIVPATRAGAISAAGHMLHIEQPDACAHAIVEFVRSIP